MQPEQFQTEPIKIKEQTDEANFQNILTAELYKVNLNGNKII
jgi:hypothetical protein